jgi:hypothetical protein
MIIFQKLYDFVNFLGVGTINQNFDKLKLALTGVVRIMTVPLGGTLTDNAIATFDVSEPLARVGDGVVVCPQTITSGLVYYGSVVTNGTIRLVIQNTKYVDGGLGINSLPLTNVITFVLIKQP